MTREQLRMRGIGEVWKQLQRGTNQGTVDNGYSALLLYSAINSKYLFRQRRPHNFAMCGEGGGTKIEYHKGDVHLLVYEPGDYKGSAYGAGEHKLSHPAFPRLDPFLLNQTQIRLLVVKPKKL